MDPLFVQSALNLLKEACGNHLNLRIRIAVDCVEKGYASHHQVAGFLGLSTDRWEQFYHNFQEGDIQKVPEVLMNLVPNRDLKFLAGFTDEQLHMLGRAVDRAVQELLNNFMCRASVVLEAPSESYSPVS